MHLYVFLKKCITEIKNSCILWCSCFCVLGRRNQLNQATSYIDASFLYGHNDEDAHELRSFMGGML